MSRLLSDLVELNYQNFFMNVEAGNMCKSPDRINERVSSKSTYQELTKNPYGASKCPSASRLPCIPARLTLFGEIRVELQLKDKWLIRKVEDCNDFSQISQTLRWGEEAMRILDKAAKRLTTCPILPSSIAIDAEVVDCVDRISFTTH